jgi:hypothetical protein
MGNTKKKFLFLFYGVLLGQNTWVPVISQVKKKVLKHYCKLSQDFKSFFLEVRLDNAELASILWREKST